ncbi:MAG: DUF3786 domain-containing protein [Desulfobacteraceae bacterium]|nr:DUF3786 domain-containing protein [Desulfobacteraceae bacterium]
MKNSKSFDKIFNECKAFVKDSHLAKKVEILGIQTQNQTLIFDFFNQRITFNGIDFIDSAGGELTQSVKSVFCRYLLMCPEKISDRSNKLVTFREFADAGPLFSSFTQNTGKIIETTFSGRLEKLKTQCVTLGGVIMETSSYDLSIRFRALHRIPIIFNFNDKDDLLPAKAIFLYHEDANTYLDLECLTITCTYLTGMLIQST